MSKLRTSRHGRSRSLAISAWPVRYKVALAVAIPLVLAATLGWLQVSNNLNEADNSSASATQVTILPPAIDYLTAAERATVAAQSSTDESAADLEKAIEDVQGAAQQLELVRDTADLTPEQRYQLDAMLDLSRAIREANDEPLSAGTWIAQLRQLQSGTTALITSIVNAQNDPEPRLEQLSQTLNGRFSLAMQQALAATARSGDTGSLELFAELGAESAAIDRLASELGEEPAIATLRTENAQRSREVRTDKATDLGGAAAYKPYDALTDDLVAGVDSSLAAAADDARRSALISGGITVGALLATIILAILVSLMLLKPLRKVRDGAHMVALEELPEEVARIRAGDEPGPVTPIDVTTNEEVGQLARAVDDLHQQAVTLAAGEAKVRAQVSEMFITLSRRNTSLINQQLGLIERLETDEEDPKRLESLFRLDHLASRMRRTADSLLVLADAPTHAAAEDGLTVASSMQAASAGVQDYQRVRVGTASNANISDAAAADVVHMLTELVDNALAYSSPTTTVELASTNGPDGVTVTVADAGLGIPNDALAKVNETLRSGAEVTPDTARRMGLFVVSRLAQRHGITVSLNRNEQSGTTATVLLPRAILDVIRPTSPVAPPPVEEAPAQAPPSQRAPDGGEPAPRSLEERLGTAAASTNLPRRQPGAQTPQTTPTPAKVTASVPPPMPDPAVPGYVAPPPGFVAPPPGFVAPPPGVVAPSPDAPAANAVDVPERAELPTRPTLSATPPSARAAEPTTAAEIAALEALAPEVAALEVPASEVAAPEVPAQTEPAITEPDTTAPAARPMTTASQHLDGDLGVMPPADSEAEADTPIFKALRSAWLSADATQETWHTSEIEVGWAEADRVAASLTEATVNASGLPVRRPGIRVVPGGVTKPAKSGARDPEAIRARLAAHAAGVSRGRAAATTATDQEENPS